MWSPVEGSSDNAARFSVVHPRSKPTIPVSIIDDLLSNMLREFYKSQYQRCDDYFRDNGAVLENFINLTFIDRTVQISNELQFSQERTVSTDEQSANVEAPYKEKEIIQLNDFFKPQEAKVCNRVLLLGPAGIGKSTSLDYICYQWARKELWRDNYDYVFLLRLRNISISVTENFSLAKLLHSETLSVSNRRRLSISDFQKILNQNAKKVLFLLDGIDEVLTKLNLRDHHDNNFLKQLFLEILDPTNNYHVIATTRPSHKQLSNYFEQHIEIVGFDDESIEQYISTCSFLNTQAAAKVSTLLQFNRSVLGSAHNPLNLALMCEIMEESSTENQSNAHISITEMYYKISARRLIKYLLHRGNKDASEMTDERIFATCHTEIIALGLLAFSAMKQEQVLITPKLIQETLKQISGIKEHEFFKSLVETGFLRTVGQSKRGLIASPHYFIHFTFQEFWAAVYLSIMLKFPNRSKLFDEVTGFIRNEKYVSRYRRVFFFLAGLTTNDEVLKKRFWYSLLADPIDIVGNQHNFIVIQCLEETNCDTSIPHYDLLIKEISQWLNIIIKILSPEDDLFIKTFNVLRQSPQFSKLPEIQFLLRSILNLSHRSALKTAITDLMDFVGIKIGHSADLVTDKEPMQSTLCKLKLGMSCEASSTLTQVFTAQMLGHQELASSVGDELGIHAIVRDLKHSKPAVQLAALKSFDRKAKVERIKLQAALLHCLASTSLEVRELAIQVLIKYRTILTYATKLQLTTFLKDKNTLLVKSSAVILKEMVTDLEPELIKRLYPLLLDSNSETRIGILQVFSGYGALMPVSLLQLLNIHLECRGDRYSIICATFRWEPTKSLHSGRRNHFLGQSRNIEWDRKSSEKHRILHSGLNRSSSFVDRSRKIDRHRKISEKQKQRISHPRLNRSSGSVDRLNLTSNYDRISELQMDVDEVMDSMLENVSKLAEREDNLEEVQCRTELLEGSYEYDVHNYDQHSMGFASSLPKIPEILIYTGIVLTLPLWLPVGITVAVTRYALDRKKERKKERERARVRERREERERQRKEEREKQCKEEREQKRQQVALERQREKEREQKRQQVAVERQEAFHETLMGSILALKKDRVDPDIQSRRQELMLTLIMTLGELAESMPKLIQASFSQYLQETDDEIIQAGIVRALGKMRASMPSYTLTKLVLLFQHSIHLKFRQALIEVLLGVEDKLEITHQEIFLKVMFDDNTPIKITKEIAYYFRRQLLKLPLFLRQKLFDIYFDKGLPVKKLLLLIYSGYGKKCQMK